MASDRKAQTAAARAAHRASAKKRDGQFATVWNAARNVREVAEHFGVTIQAASARAGAARRRSEP